MKCRGKMNRLRLHIFSNGPAIQYKQKGNFYLFSTQLAKRGIKYATWNFHESGHGKGAPDGIDGVLKRTANAKVLQGHDIPDAKCFLQTLQNENLNISLYYVPPKDIDVIREANPQSSPKYHETTPDHHRPIRRNFL